MKHCDQIKTALIVIESEADMMPFRTKKWVYIKEKSAYVLMF